DRHRKGLAIQVADGYGRTDQYRDSPPYNIFCWSHHTSSANVDYTREASKRLLHFSIPLQSLASKQRASGDETATLWTTGGRDYSDGSPMEPPGCLEGIGCRVCCDRFTSRPRKKTAGRTNRGAAG